MKLKTKLQILTATLFGLLLFLLLFFFPILVSEDLHKVGIGEAALAVIPIIRLQLFFITATILLCVLLFVWSLNRLFVSPLIELDKAISEVSKGNYDAAILPPIEERKDEIAHLVNGVAKMIVGLKEREKIRALLDKVVSKDIADEILKNPPHLGGEDRAISMLFSDIRGFTTLTDSLSPQKTIEILNFYMTKMSRVIENEGGLIDKFVGDEIMALFGAPVSHPQHALRAISTGMLMQETLKKINEERMSAKEPVFEMGIAVHTGIVVAGNMGAEDRLNYTVLGRNVNLAARLCQSAGAGQLIISEFTLKEPAVSESFIVKPLAPIRLKGFSEPVNIFEVCSFKWES